MPVQFVTGDLFLTRAQTIGVGVAATGRLGTSDVGAAFGDRYPVFVGECLRRGRARTLTPGTVWIWREARPWLAALIVRETPQGATRLRYVESALLAIVRQWEDEQLHSLALLRLGDAGEWPQVRLLLEHTLAGFAARIIVYEDHQPGVDAEAESAP